MNILSNPKKIHFLKDLTKDSNLLELDTNLFHNTFEVFKSKENILFLIYINQNNSIISYDLIRNQKINEIKKAHSSLITNLHYCYDKKNKIDLILSISFTDNTIKLWNMNNCSLLLNLANINNDGLLKTACFLKTKDHIYIVSSNFNYNYSFNNEPIKIFNLDGQKIKEIKDSKDITFFIDTFYDDNINKYYIFTGNSGNAKAYDYEENIIYKRFSEKDKIYRVYHNIIINKNGNIIQFIALSNDNYIRIWNFHSGDLLKSIYVKNDNILSYNMLFSIYIWNNDYLFVSSSDESLKLIEIKNGEIVKNISGLNCEMLTLKKFFLPDYGDCLISHCSRNMQIKLWITEN